MPELWRKIEARQFFLARVKKLTQVFVAAAAAICLLLGIALQVPVATNRQAVTRQLCGRARGCQSYRNLTALVSGSTTLNQTENDA